MAFLTVAKIALRQPEPPEGRQMYALGTGPGGADGLPFVTGTEQFKFDSEQVPGAQKPSAIMGMWVDATNLTAGKNLVITTPFQTFVFAGGNQGYVPITAPPGRFSMTVTSGGGTGTVSVTLYNYNPLFTGAVATVPTQGTFRSGGSSGSGGGGLGGQDTGGGGGLSGPPILGGPQT